MKWDCMTLLLFRHTPENVAIVMDTLATSAEGEPLNFMSKCRAMPHLKLAVAWTGVGTFGLRWCVALEEQVLSRDIEMLNEYAPEVISRIWKDLGEEQDLRGMTSTIYHFGLSERTGQYVGYAYRSTKGFVSDPIPYGFGVKPPLAALDELVEPDDVPDWITLAAAIRAEQDALPAGQRVSVGGALTLTMLREGSAITTEVHRFDDFDAMWNEMNFINSSL